MRFRWHVAGTDYRPHSNMVWPFEDHDVVEADSLPEAVEWLLHRGPFWELIDTHRPVTLCIEPLDD